MIRRTAASAVTLTLAAMWTVALAVGPDAGMAFAQVYAPPAPPPVSYLPTTTAAPAITGYGTPYSMYAAAEADGAAVLAGDAAVGAVGDGAVAAGTICAAATA